MEFFGEYKGRKENERKGNERKGARDTQGSQGKWTQRRKGTARFARKMNARAQGDRKGRKENERKGTCGGSKEDKFRNSYKPINTPSSSVLIS